MPTIIIRNTNKGVVVGTKDGESMPELEIRLLRAIHTAADAQGISPEEVVRRANEYLMSARTGDAPSE